MILSLLLSCRLKPLGFRQRTREPRPCANTQHRCSRIHAGNSSGDSRIRARATCPHGLDRMSILVRGAYPRVPWCPTARGGILFHPPLPPGEGQGVRALPASHLTTHRRAGEANMTPSLRNHLPAAVATIFLAAIGADIQIAAWHKHPRASAFQINHFFDQHRVHPFSPTSWFPSPVGRGVGGEGIIRGASLRASPSLFLHHPLYCTFVQ